MQLVRYARTYEEFERRGARIAGISVDLPEHNKVMIEKLAFSFTLLSDPIGRPRQTLRPVER